MKPRENQLFQIRLHCMTIHTQTDFYPPTVYCIRSAETQTTKGKDEQENRCKVIPGITFCLLCFHARCSFKMCCYMLDIPSYQVDYEPKLFISRFFICVNIQNLIFYRSMIPVNNKIQKEEN